VRDFANTFKTDKREVRCLIPLTDKLGRRPAGGRPFLASEGTQEMVAIILDVAAQSKDGCGTRCTTPETFPR
jgi:hypothetical protein